MTSIIAITIVVLFVVATLAIVGHALYECTPLPHRSNPYRDAATGRRRWQSPHVDDPHQGFE